MREHRTKAGKLMYYASRAELEALPGYRSNNRQGRACCPIHGGDNPTALSINWATGWARCFSCGDAWAIRVEDHLNAFQPRGNDTAPHPQRPHDRPRRDEHHALSADGSQHRPSSAINVAARVLQETAA